jgi:hypothetical protein
LPSDLDPFVDEGRADPALPIARRQACRLADRQSSRSGRAMINSSGNVDWGAKSWLFPVAALAASRINSD